MRSKMLTTMIVIAGAMFLFGPNATAQDSQGADKSKKTPAKANKQKANKQETKKNEARADTSMSVIDAKTTTKVEEREAVSPSESFSTGDKVTVWLAVKNPEEAGKINLVFFRNEAEAGTIELNVGKSYRWRTWARRTVGSAGDWKVDVRDSDGNSLKTLEFKVN